ncbi:MAG: dicarboxylate/amino acid:cation symporter [Blastocatellia bacterium]
MKRISLTGWIFIGMAIGILCGVIAPDIAVELSPLSSIFLRLIKVVIAPLTFGALVSGIAGNSAGGGNLRGLGRLGGKSLIYFWTVTTLALAFGMIAALVGRPGAGVIVPNQTAKTELPVSPSVGAMLEQMFPNSFFDAMARTDVLQVMIFSLLFGIACAAIGSEAKPVVDFAEALSKVMFRLMNYVMVFAPLGVGAAVAVTVGSGGLKSLFGLSKLALTGFAAFFAFAVLVLTPLLLWSRVPLRRFFDAMREPFLIAFTTTSSGAALPKAMENFEKLGIPNRIISLVLPACFALNLTGTTIYLPVSALFVAQSAGIELPAKQLLMMFLILMVTSKGATAVPRTGLVILIGTLHTFNLPLEAIPLLLSVDIFLDLARTSVNIFGHCVAAVAIARWEGETFQSENFSAPQAEGNLP